MYYNIPILICLSLVLSIENCHAFHLGDKIVRTHISMNVCPDSLDSQYNQSSELIRVLLTSNSPIREQERLESGISHLDFNNLELLTSPSNDYACTQLNSFKDNWLDNATGMEYTYYKIEDYYFLVRWYNGNSTGFQPVFVFNSQIELVGAWSI